MEIQRCFIFFVVLFVLFYVNYTTAVELYKEKEEIENNYFTKFSQGEDEIMKEKNGKDSDTALLFEMISNLQNKVDVMQQRLNATEYWVLTEQKGGNRIRRDIGQDLPQSGIPGCPPGTLGCQAPYTPYFMGQCFLCPPGAAGPRGLPGSEGQRGRDGRDGRDGEHGSKGDSGSCISDGQLEEPSTESRSASNSNGAVFVRWGRSECPSTSEIVYSGIAGGEYYTNEGGSTNYICLPQEPIYDEPETSAHTSRGFVYGTEYETSTYPPYAHLHNNKVPCVVCKATGRPSYIMIPARNICPGSEWTREYYGHLMTAYNGHKRTEFICIDRNAEYVHHTAFNVNGALLYPVEGRCSSSGGIPCGPYVNGYELTCAVCTL